VLVSFDENYITVLAANFSYRYHVFTYWTIRSKVRYKNGCKIQDQNQGRPRATRTHCGRIG